jgi:hypothetical protein
MRWRHPRVDDRRLGWRFLILPLRIQAESRWLEWACVEQRAVPHERGTRWADIAFVDLPRTDSMHPDKFLSL